MPDIAQLGLAIDSGQVTTASAALDRFAASAKPAAAAVNTLESAMAAAVGDANVLAVAIKNGTTQSDAHSQSLRGQRLVLRGIAGDLALFGSQLGTAAQVASVLYIENAHLFEGFGGLKNAIAGIITPFNLFIGGLAAITVGGYLAYESVKKTELEFGALSDRTVTTVQNLHALASAAAFKGIDNTDFLKGMEKFGDLTVDALHNTGSLADVFKANGVQVGSLNDNLLHAADLIKNAGSEAEKYRLITQLGLPATREWVEYLSQGSAGLRAAQAEAVKLGGAVDEQLIAKARKFDDDWNKAWNDFSTRGKSAVVSVAGWLDTLADKAQAGLLSFADAIGRGEAVKQRLMANSLRMGLGSQLTTSDANSFYDSTGADKSDSSKTTVNPADTIRQLTLENQHIGALGSLATITQQVTARTNELAIARMQPGNLLTDTDVSRIRAYTEAQALGTLAIHAQADAQRIEGDTVTMGVGAAAAFRAEQERLADFRSRGIALTDKQVASLHNEAAALGEATQATALKRAADEAAFATSQFGRSDASAQAATAMRALYGDEYQSHLDDALAGQIRLNSALSDAKSVSQNALTGFVQDLRAGTDEATAFSNAVGKFADKLIDMASNQAISGLFKAFLPGTSGINTPGGTVYTPGPLEAAVNHTGYGPGDSFPTRMVAPEHFSNAPRFHSGIGPGERAAVIKDNESVLTPGQMKALAPAGGGQPITINNYNDFSGADPGTEARMKAYVDKSSQAAVSQAVEAVARIKGNSPSYLK